MEERKPRSFNKTVETRRATATKGEGRREKGERKSTDDRPKRTYERRSDTDERPKRTYDRKSSTAERPRRTFDRKSSTAERPRRTFDRKSGTDERPRRTFDRKLGTDEPPKRSYVRKSNSEERPRRSFDRKPSTEERPKKIIIKKTDSDAPPPRKRRDVTAESEILTEIVELRRREGRSAPRKQKILSLEHEEKHGPIRLNKYISNSGICSRRDADMLIETGAIQVNGKIVTELGTKVLPTDEVRFGDRILQREKPVYLLLNKPKEFITTMEDERDRKHVLQLVKGACKERIYPVGRLDKNTTGLLLFTNDGEMTKKLTHPKHGIRKVYYVELNKNLTSTDFEKIANGIELSDGEIKVDEIAYAGDSKREIGITLHSGRNRIVRRIFEQLGYEIVKLDRVVFAGLTKKDLPRGKFRFLSDQEINFLKMI